MEGPALTATPATACPDWAERLQRKKMPISSHRLPLKTANANRISGIFNNLIMPDLDNTPFIGDIKETTWWTDQVGRALFGGDTVREAFVMVSKKQSKCLALDTPVVTPDGFTLMKDLEIGDTVFDPNGEPCQVIGKSPVHLGNRCFEVEFSTGEVVVCDADHRWWVDTHVGRPRGGSNWGFRTTAEMVGNVIAYENPDGRYQIRNYRTAVAAPLYLPDIVLPVDPYIFGYWLGDGTTGQASFTCHVDDAPHLVEALEASFYSVKRIHPDKRRPTTLTISCAGDIVRDRDTGQFAHDPSVLQMQMKYYGVWHEKRIPDVYMRASARQRLELLQGLLDSDGHVNLGSSKTGGVIFSQSDRGLINDVFELVASLGFKPKIKEYRAIHKGVDHGPTWRILFSAYRQDEVFRLPRKLNRLPLRGDRTPRSAFRQIVRIEEVPSVPTQCIKVSSKTEQFLIGPSMIPTGNTSSGSLLYLAAFLANRVPQLSHTILAPTVSIAQFSFDQIVGAIIADPELAARTHIKRNEKRIEHLQTRAVLQVKSASLESLTGLKGSVFVDELHLWGTMRDGQKLRSQLRGALAVNKAARALYITTQSDDVPAGVFKNMLTYARHVRDGTIIDPAFLPVIFEPWKDADPWTDERLWPMLLPSYPHIADASFYRSMIAESNSSGPSAIAKDKSQYFNIEIGAGEGGNGWVIAQSYGKLKRVRCTLDEMTAQCSRIAIGVDMGGAGDLTALVVLGETKGGSWLVWCRGWLTGHGWSENVMNHSRFQDFEDAGDLKTIEAGEDASDIVDICIDLRATGKLAGIGVDPAAAADLGDALEAAGFEMERDLHGIGQTAFRLAPAVRTLERRAEQGRLSFIDQGLMAWALGNVVVTKKGNAPCIDKQTALDRIDPVAALLDAATIMISQKEPAFDATAMIG